MTPWTVACQAPLSKGFLRQEYLEWVAISFSMSSSWSRGWTLVSCSVWWVLYHWVTREALCTLCSSQNYRSHSWPPHHAHNVSCSLSDMTPEMYLEFGFLLSSLLWFSYLKPLPALIQLLEKPSVLAFPLPFILSSNPLKKKKLCKIFGEYVCLLLKRCQWLHTLLELNPQHGL